MNNFIKQCRNFQVTGIFIAILLLAATTANAQYPIKTEVALSNMVFRLDINKVTDESYQLKITRIIGDTSLFKEESIRYLMEWNQELYSATVTKTIRELWKGKDDFSGWLEADNLDKLLTEAYDKLEEKRSAGSVDKLLQENYGLSDEQVIKYTKDLNKLIIVQDTIKSLCNQKSLLKIQLDMEPARIEERQTLGYTKQELKLDTARRIATKNSVVAIEKDLTSKKQGAEKTLEEYIAEKRLLKTQLRRINSQRKFVSSLIGNSNVVSSFRTIERSEVNAGFGVVAVKSGFAEFLAIITVAESSNNLSADETVVFGQSVLVPGVSKFSFLSSYRSFSIFRYSPSQFWRKLGVGLDVNVTPYRWERTSDSATTSIIPFAFNIMLPYTWILENSKDRSFIISTEVGIASRYIGGDATNEEILSFLGNDKRFYAGPTVGINIKYNALRAQFHAPLFITNKRVPGLTNGQVYASIGIVGSLISDITGVIKDRSK